MNIIVNCERMKHRYTGLHSFCLHLSRALLAERKPAYPRLKMYIPQSAVQEINSPEFIIQQDWHKLLKLSSKHFDLWHETSQDGSYFPFRSRSKKVLTIHDVNYLQDETKSQAKKDRFLKSLQQQIDHSDHITAISQFTLDAVKKFADLGSKPVKVIYNGCNMPGTADPARPAFIKNEMKFLFTIGTVLRKKNFHVLPALLSDRDLCLVIAGEIVSPKYHEAIVAEAKKHKVSDRILFTGGITENEKWWLYGNMEAFVFPSIAEGFGLPVIEAMNFGKPVILSKETSLPEIGGSEAYYFDSFDPVSMNRIVDEALKDYYSKPGKPGEIKAHAQSFNWNNTARQYWEVYAGLLGFTY
jgi:glycosyltransferase involved in cell wall biosynthesis